MNTEEAEEIINEIVEALKLLPDYIKEYEFRHIILSDNSNFIHGNISIHCHMHNNCDPCHMHNNCEEEMTLLLHPKRISFCMYIVYDEIINNCISYEVDILYQPKRILKKDLEILLEQFPQNEKQIEEIIEALNNHREDLPKYILK